MGEENSEVTSRKIEENEYSLASPEKVMAYILAHPGAKATEISDGLNIRVTNVYNYVARLREQMRIKTITSGPTSRYYPFNFAMLDIPALDEPGARLIVGDDQLEVRKLTAEDLKKLTNRPTIQTKYLELLGYLDRLEIGEAALFPSDKFSKGSLRDPIRAYFKENKKFSTNNRPPHLIVERIK